MSYLTGLRRAWISIAVPGTTSAGGPPTTYVRYPHDELPALPSDDLADWDWLRGSDRHPHSSLAVPYEDAVRDLTSAEVLEVVGSRAAPPADLISFLADPRLREHLRSATNCYFDAGDRVVDVPGGYLLHVVSDSQWVQHWLVFVGDDGVSAVVSTPLPMGFDLDDEDVGDPGYDEVAPLVCAESFAEFVWRWWMDNEIFYRVAVDREAPDPEQTSYVGQYGRSVRIDAPW